MATIKGILMTNDGATIIHITKHGLAARIESIRAHLDCKYIRTVLPPSDDLAVYINDRGYSDDLAINQRFEDAFNGFIRGPAVILGARDSKTSIETDVPLNIQQYLLD